MKKTSAIWIMASLGLKLAASAEPKTLPPPVIDRFWYDPMICGATWSLPLTWEELPSNHWFKALSSIPLSTEQTRALARGRMDSISINFTNETGSIEQFDIQRPQPITVNVTNETGLVVFIHCYSTNRTVEFICENPYTNLVAAYYRVLGSIDLSVTTDERLPYYRPIWQRQDELSAAKKSFANAETGTKTFETGK